MGTVDDNQGSRDVAAAIGLFGTFCCIAKHHSIVVKRVVCTKYYTVIICLSLYMLPSLSILNQQAQADPSYSQKD